MYTDASQTLGVMSIAFLLARCAGTGNITTIINITFIINIPFDITITTMMINLSSQDEAVIWRGPKKNAMIKYDHHSLKEYYDNHDDDEHDDHDV